LCRGARYRTILLTAARAARESRFLTRGHRFWLLSLLLCSAVAQASRWLDVGTTGVTMDKVLVDLDSVRKVDNLRTVDIMTVYAAPRENAHHITLDRHLQKTAFDCAQRTFIGIRTLGYLGEKQVGSGPERADWKTSLQPIGDNPLNKRVFDAVCNAPVSDATAGNAVPRPKTVSGSGIVVDEFGAILTAGHVVAHCKSLTVKSPDSKPLDARVEAVDPKNDLALVKINYDVPLGEPAHFRSTATPAKLGESIGVIGYPLVGYLSAEPKATFGQVNSVAGANNDYTLLQISAPVQPGNSGGPVVDASGQVIGVVVGEAPAAIVAVTGALPQNVNFAVRGEVAQIFLTARGIKLRSGGHAHNLSTEDMAAAGLKSTVFIQCQSE
jgi:S1-C subfamily serine protease